MYSNMLDYSYIKIGYLLNENHLLSYGFFWFIRVQVGCAERDLALMPERINTGCLEQQILSQSISVFLTLGKK